ncbi:MAG: hypothetical protein ACT4OY_07690 [Alphaproteobacteria bacterium]
MRRFIILISVLLLTACQSTRTQGVSFIDPDFRGPTFRSLVVEGQADLGERQALEFAASDMLYANGVKGIPAIKLIPPTKQWSEKQRKREAVKSGADGILVIALVDKDVVSSRSYAGGPYYDAGFYGGRHHSGVGVGVGFPIGSPFPDYRELRAEEGTYQATLYSLPGFNTVWTGEFKTRGPYEMEYDVISENVAKQVVARLRADGVI